MRTGERFGAAHLADVLTGEASDTIRRHGHDTLKTFGVGKERAQARLADDVRQLFAAGALAEASAEHGGFRLTEKGEAILLGRETIVAARVADRPRAAAARPRRAVDRADGLDGPTAALFEHLRALRLDLARREGIAAYMVFADRTLIDMARPRPATRGELLAVDGVGERKLARYGDLFLAAINDGVRS